MQKAPTKRIGIYKSGFMVYRNSLTFMTAIDKNSPLRLKSKKMNNSIDYQEINNMVDNDDEIRMHKLEIEKLKRDQQRQLEKYLKNEIGMIWIFFIVLMIFI